MFLASFFLQRRFLLRRQRRAARTPAPTTFHSDFRIRVQLVVVADDVTQDGDVRVVAGVAVQRDERGDESADRGGDGDGGRERDGVDRAD